MNNIDFKITIDGEQWSKKQIERLEYERNLHVLHQMNRHGIVIKDGDKELTGDDIDCLSMEKAWEISINTRLLYTGEEIVKYYKESLERSDKFWRELPFGQELPMEVSYCDLSVDGVTLDEYMEMMMGLQVDERNGLAAHPEHFTAIMSDEKIIGIEPFGMYGTPTLCQVQFADVEDLGEKIKSDRDPEYPVSMAGRAYLTDGVTEINCPYHQFKPRENGFDAKLAVYWPEGTPKEIVSGHCLHLAMEFYQGLRQVKKGD